MRIGVPNNTTALLWLQALQTSPCTLIFVPNTISTQARTPHKHPAPVMKSYSWEQLIGLALAAIYWIIQQANSRSPEAPTADEPATPIAPTPAVPDHSREQPFWETTAWPISVEPLPTPTTAPPSVATVPTPPTQKLLSKCQEAPQRLRRYHGWKKAVVMEALLQRHSSAAY
ncbi:MAG: hypothetical protein AAFQ78_01220 [Bacteroidota bacterium]